jgi:hypothetical protein
MNGTVRVGRHTVTRAGKRTTITGPHIRSRDEFRRLRDEADAMLAAEPVPSHRRTWGGAELVELLARGANLKPIPLEPSSGNGRWKDSLNSDSWGAPPRGHQLLRRAWSNGQCLQACIASLLGADVTKVPNPEASYDAARDDWHDHYNTQLEQATGHRLDFIPASLCPPKNPNQLWVAGVREPDEEAGHAVVARGAYVVHDPAGIYRGSLPLNLVVDGMIVTPTKRLAPILSPRGSGYTVVSA